MERPLDRLNPEKRKAVIEHYGIEKQLAEALRRSSKEERKRLYSCVYDELFKKVTRHPQLLEADKRTRKKKIRLQRRLASPFLGGEKVFLEIGAGDCSFSLGVAADVKNVYALDVTNRFIDSIGVETPGNFKFVRFDGVFLPFGTGSIDVAYSYQLMEHLHPDDAVEQLKEICRVLKMGGFYICATPHRYSGPHDISLYFDCEARGLHLKEYTYREITALLKSAGFSKVSIYSHLIYFLRMPLSLIFFVERAVAAVPLRYRRSIANLPILKQLLGIFVVARK